MAPKAAEECLSLLGILIVGPWDLIDYLFCGIVVVGNDVVVVGAPVEATVAAVADVVVVAGAVDVVVVAANVVVVAGADVVVVVETGQLIGNTRLIDQLIETVDPGGISTRLTINTGLLFSLLYITALNRY